MAGYFYIMASARNGTLYCGVTNDIARRATEHRRGQFKGFPARYKTNLLIYCEDYEDISDAIHREKCVKEWKRKWKLDLIESVNPAWRDLYDDLASL